MKKHIHLIDDEISQKLLTINEIYHEADLSLSTYYAIEWNNHRTADTIVPTYVRDLAKLKFKNFIIEISKLLKHSRNESYNLFDFLYTVINERHDYDVDTTLLTVYLGELTSYKTNVIDSILKSRDKKFAHTDYEDYKYVSSYFQNEKTKPLIEIIEKILDQLNIKVKINKKLTYFELRNIGPYNFWNEVYIKIFNDIDHKPQNI